MLHWPNAAKKNDVDSTEMLTDDDFAGEVSAKALKGAGKTFNNDNEFFGKLNLPMIGNLFGLCKNECESRKLTMLLIIYDSSLFRTSVANN